MARPFPIRFLSFLFLFCVTNAPVRAETDWLSGKELQDELDRPLGITWSGQPIRQALANLSINHGIAIWLDRRIDPGRELELSVEEIPLRVLLQRAASLAEAEVGVVGPVVYVGPPSTATKLWTVAELRNEDSRRLPAERRARWTARRPVEWEELSTPKELLAAVAQESGCKFEGIEQIPHDLWPAANLPSMTLAERLTLILAGFELTYELAHNGSLIRLAPWPQNPVLRREYSTTRDAARLAAELTEAFPTATLKRVGTKIAVTGTAEDHDSISRLLHGETVQRPAPKSRTSPAKGSTSQEPETRYTIEVKNQPIGAVLRTLEIQSQLQLIIDPNVQPKLRELVSFKLKDATLEQLLRSTLQGAGLDFQLNGRQLRIAAAKP